LKVSAMLGIVPTGVGVNLDRVRRLALERHCPHGRGGEPGSQFGGALLAELSPRAWG